MGPSREPYAHGTMWPCGNSLVAVCTTCKNINSLFVFVFACRDAYEELRGMLVAISQETYLELRRAEVALASNPTACAKQVLVGTIHRFVKHRGGLINEAALNALACSRSGLARPVSSGVYYSLAADFDLLRRLVGGPQAGPTTDPQLIAYCDVLQRAYDRRSAVQDGMQGFPAMALAIEPPNVQLVDLVCMLVPEQRLVVAECLLLQAAVEDALRSPIPVDIRAVVASSSVDPVTASSLDGTQSAGSVGLVSFVFDSGQPTFGALAGLLRGELPRVSRSLLSCLASGVIGPGSRGCVVFSSLKDCVPLHLCVGKDCPSSMPRAG